MWTNYYLAASISDALDLLASAPEETKIIAGATDLLLEIKRGLRENISTLVDVSRIPSMDRIYLDDNENIHIGALTTHNQIASSKLIQERAKCLAQASFQVGSPQIRNRGTLAGNVVTASPANDTIPALIALGAEIIMISKTGERRIKVEDFFTGVRQTRLSKDELVTEFILPKVNSNTHSIFYKFALRNAQAISLVNAAVLVQTRDNVLTEVRIAVGAVAPTVNRLKRTEATLIGKNLHHLSDEDFKLIAEEIHPISDIRSSDQFRIEMARFAVRHCFDFLLDPDHFDQPLPDKPVTLSGNSNEFRSLSKTILINSKTPIQSKINGKEYLFQSKDQKSLLDIIRDDANLPGTKEGCAEGECGACTVHFEDKAVMACLVPAPRAHLAVVTTIEGISEEGTLHPLQESFIKEGAVQCGYCTPGFIMSSAKLLEERRHPDLQEIKGALTGNLCRCTGYYKIIRAIEQAAESGGLDDET